MAVNAKGRKQARKDSNPTEKRRGKQAIAEAGAAKSAADSGDGSLSEALAMIARLPLTDAEKAEAVRRLLASHDGP